MTKATVQMNSMDRGKAAQAAVTRWDVLEADGRVVGSPV